MDTPAPVRWDRSAAVVRPRCCLGPGSWGPCPAGTTSLHLSARDGTRGRGVNRHPVPRRSTSSPSPEGETPGPHGAGVGDRSERTPSGGKHLGTGCRIRRGRPPSGRSDRRSGPRCSVPALRGSRCPARCPPLHQCGRRGGGHGRGAVHRPEPGPARPSLGRAGRPSGVRGRHRAHRGRHRVPAGFPPSGATRGALSPPWGRGRPARRQRPARPAAPGSAPHSRCRPWRCSRTGSPRGRPARRCPGAPTACRRARTP